MMCPLCASPTEAEQAYGDRACPRCGLAAPPDVLERIAQAVADAAALTPAYERGKRDALQPAHVLDAAERLLRGALPHAGYIEVAFFGESVAISDRYDGIPVAPEMPSLAEAYAKLKGGDHG